MAVKVKSFCCEAFAAEARILGSLVGGGFLYPRGMRPPSQIEQEEDGSWNVNGCCGGGCYVLSDIKFSHFAEQNSQEKKFSLCPTFPSGLIIKSANF